MKFCIETAQSYTGSHCWARHACEGRAGGVFGGKGIEEGNSSLGGDEDSKGVLCLILTLVLSLKTQDGSSFLHQQFSWYKPTEAAGAQRWLTELMFSYFEETSGCLSAHVGYCSSCFSVIWQPR